MGDSAFNSFYNVLIFWRVSSIDLHPKVMLVLMLVTSLSSAYCCCISVSNKSCTNYESVDRVDLLVTGAEFL